MELAQPGPLAVNAPRGARLLFFSQLVVLAGVLVQALIFHLLIPRYGVGDTLTLIRWNGTAWALIGVLELVAIAAFVSGRPDGERSWAVTALVLSTIGLLDTFGMLVVDALQLHLEPGTSWNALMLLAGLGFEVCLWLAASKALGRGLGVSGAFYLLLCALSSAVSIGFMIAGPTWHRDLPLGAVELIGWGRLAASVARVGMVVWLLYALAFRFEGAGVTPALAAPAPSGGRDILVGAVWLVCGLLVTIASYSLASSGVGGGRYVITTGAIAYGRVRLSRGLARAGSATG